MAAQAIAYTSFDKKQSLESLIEARCMQPLSSAMQSLHCRDVSHWIHEHDDRHCRGFQTTLEKSKKAWSKTFEAESKKVSKQFMRDLLDEKKSLSGTLLSTMVDFPSNAVGLLGKSSAQDKIARIANLKSIEILSNKLLEEVSWMQTVCASAYRLIQDAQRSQDVKRESQTLIDLLSPLIHDCLQEIDTPITG
jgi:hypothetical protein